MVHLIRFSVNFRFWKNRNKISSPGEALGRGQAACVETRLWRSRHRQNQTLPRPQDIRSPKRSQEQFHKITIWSCPTPQVFWLSKNHSVPITGELKLSWHLRDNICSSVQTLILWNQIQNFLVLQNWRKLLWIQDFLKRFAEEFFQWSVGASLQISG